MTIQIIPVDGIGEVQAGDDLVELIESAFAASGDSLRPGDVLVVAQKVISKAEGRIRRLQDVAPSERAVRLAAELDRDARIVRCVLDEARAILRAERGVIPRSHLGGDARRRSRVLRPTERDMFR